MALNYKHKEIFISLFHFRHHFTLSLAGAGRTGRPRGGTTVLPAVLPAVLEAALKAAQGCQLAYACYPPDEECACHVVHFCVRLTPLSMGKGPFEGTLSTRSITYRGPTQGSRGPTQGRAGGGFGHETCFKSRDLFRSTERLLRKSPYKMHLEM